MMYNPNVVDRTLPTLAKLYRTVGGLWIWTPYWGRKNHFEPIEDEV